MDRSFRRSGHAPTLLCSFLYFDFSSPVRFFGRDGMDAPLPEDGLWFLSQYRRWGMLKREVDWVQVAADASATALFDAAAAHLHLETRPPVSATLIDEVI